MKKLFYLSLLFLNSSVLFAAEQQRAQAQIDFRALLVELRNRADQLLLQGHDISHEQAAAFQELMQRREAVLEEMLAGEDFPVHQEVINNNNNNQNNNNNNQNNNNN